MTPTEKIARMLHHAFEAYLTENPEDLDVGPVEIDWAEGTAYFCIDREDEEPLIVEVW